MGATLSVIGFHQYNAYTTNVAPTGGRGFDSSAADSEASVSSGCQADNENRGEAEAPTFARHSEASADSSEASVSSGCQAEK